MWCAVVLCAVRCVVVWCGVCSPVEKGSAGQIQLNLHALKPFAIIQHRALDFPYRHWTLTPNGTNSVLLRVIGSRLEAVFELVGAEVRLLAPVLSTTPHTYLASLQNRLMEPGVLFAKLAECGLNLMPTDADAKFCRKPIKTGFLEAKLHEQIAEYVWLCGARVCLPCLALPCLALPCLCVVMCVGVRLTFCLCVRLLCCVVLCCGVVVCAARSK
jgi:hypothetical protein